MPRGGVALTGELAIESMVGQHPTPQPISSLPLNLRIAPSRLRRHGMINLNGVILLYYIYKIIKYIYFLFIHLYHEWNDNKFLMP
jgi:hypothetical protein